MNEPFYHIILNDFFDRASLEDAAAAWPAPDWPHWLRYDNPLERKRACNNWKEMPVPISRLLQRLMTIELPFKNIAVDLTAYGAGMHSMGRGDHLDLHLDADRHPVFGMERRVNAILFIHQQWQEEWGGALEFWADQRCALKITPRPGRLVIFETSDHSYHGVPDPIRCPENVWRQSLAAYWWGPMAGPSKRPRAQFVARPTDAPDPAKDELRQARMRFSK